MIGCQFFQDLDVGGIAGLGLFAMGQIKLFKEDVAQLFWRVDVELLASLLVDGAFQLINED